MKFSSNEWYEQRARDYKKSDKYALRRYEKAVRVADISDGMNIADIGCKDGVLMRVLKEKNLEIDYFGIDISESALDMFDDCINIHIKQADIMDGIPIENNWADVVFCLEVIEHLITPLTAIEEIARILKKNGRALISVPNPYYWGKILKNILKSPDREGHISTFTWVEINRLCEFGGLKVVKTVKGFDVIPYAWKGVRKGKYFCLRAISSIQSISNLYIAKKI
jgi:SAM-dependent methyltransferase